MVSSFPTGSFKAQVALPWSNFSAVVVRNLDCVVRSGSGNLNRLFLDRLAELWGCGVVDGLLGFCVVGL